MIDKIQEFITRGPLGPTVQQCSCLANVDVTEAILDIHCDTT